MGVSRAAAVIGALRPDTVDRVSAPWLMLVSPAACWEFLRQHPALWPALVWQMAAVVIGRLVSVHAMSELDVAAQVPALAGTHAWLSFVSSLVVLLLVVAAANLGLALVLKLAALFAGGGISWFSALQLAAYALLPFAAGDALGRCAFAMILPLSTTLAGAWAMHLRPFSLGLATFMPKELPALSLPWFAASFFDLFGLWSLACIWSGLRFFVGLKPVRSLWVMLGVVLLLALVLAAAWQMSQIALLRAAH